MSDKIHIEVKFKGMKKTLDVMTYDDGVQYDDGMQFDDSEGSPIRVREPSVRSVEAMCRQLVVAFRIILEEFGFE